QMNAACDGQIGRVVHSAGDIDRICNGATKLLCFRGVDREGSPEEMGDASVGERTEPGRRIESGSQDDHRAGGAGDAELADVNRARQVDGGVGGVERGGRVGEVEDAVVVQYRVDVELAATDHESAKVPDYDVLGGYHTAR